MASQNSKFVLRAESLQPNLFRFSKFSHQNTKEISDNIFFRARKIHIPVKVGRKGIRKNKYEHLKKEPVWKPFLECDCKILDQATEGGDALNICLYGKIVNLSRGVGGNRSFFVHVPKDEESFKVIAHICFEPNVPAT